MTPQFLIFRSILKTPTWHRELVDKLKARHPEEPIEVVDAITLLALLKRYEREK
jgi:hypothetical protein